MKTAADILASKQQRLITIDSDKTIAEALQVMRANKIGSILLTDPQARDIVGIWTERDLMGNVLTDGFNPRTAKIGSYMTANLHSAPQEATLHEVKEMMLSLFIRHLLITHEQRYVGILSVGDIVRASLIAQDQQIKALKAHTSWNYYEKWAW